MFDNLLGGKFSKKCKYCVKSINSRIVLIRKKRQATVRFLKKDVTDLLANGHDSNAFGRIEALIVEINHTSCYDMIEQFGQCILNQLPSLQKQRDCPEEAMEAVSTLIFAAARFSDLPELSDLRRAFTERYGSHMESSVNAEFVEKIQKKTFSTEKKLRLMKDIADELSVRWDSKAFQQKLSNPTAPPSDQSKRRSCSDTNGKNSSKEAVFDVHNEANSRNKPALKAGGSFNSRTEEAFNADVASNGRNEAPINSNVAVNGRDRAVLNGGGSFNHRKELVFSAADIAANGRKKTDIESDITFNQEPPPRISVQKQQVHPEPRDIHVIPITRNGRSHNPAEKSRKVSAFNAAAAAAAAAKETENMEPVYDDAGARAYARPVGNQSDIHTDDWLKKGVARNRSPRAREELLIGIKEESLGPVISRDVKAVNMIPPYTKQNGNRNGGRNDLRDMPIYDELPKAQMESDPNFQDRRSTLPKNSKDARPVNNIPSYYDGFEKGLEPNFRETKPTRSENNFKDARARSTIPPRIYDESPKAEKGLDPDDQETKPATLQAKTSKDARPMNMIPPPYTKPNNKKNPVFADDIKLTDVPGHYGSSAAVDYERSNVGERIKPVSVRSRVPRAPPVINIDNAVADEKIMNHIPNDRRKERRQLNGDFYAEEIVHRHQRKVAAEEEIYATSSAQRNNGGRRSTVAYEGDCDEEEEAMDRLLVHYSKKALNNELSKRRERARARHELVVERVASLPTKSISPVAEIGVVGKGPVRANSIQPDMLSPNGVRPGLPDYDVLAARFLALKKT